MADESPDDVIDEPVEPPVRRKKKTANQRSRGGIVVMMIAIAAIVWGVYENRRAVNLEGMLSAAQADNATLSGRVAEMEKLMNETAAKLDALTKRKMPVSVIFRRTRSGSGFTAYFKNNAPEPVNVSVLLTNPLTNRRRESNLAILANEVQEIGEAQGWIFTPGQRILMTHAQLGSVEFVVPSE